MKISFIKLAVYSIIGIALFQCSTENPNEIIVRGNVENSNQDYIILGYSPRYRGILSFDRYKNIGSQINKSGRFTLTSEKVTDGANYSLLFKNSGIRLPLFKGDNIEVDFDINNPDETLFVTGEGAGKINILKLEQFERKSLSDLDLSLKEYVKYSDSIAAIQQGILNAIFTNDLSVESIKSARNCSKIEMIIKENELSKKEYDFIDLIIYVQKLSLISYVSYLSQLYPQDSSELNFNDKIFKDFNINDYKRITNLNNWRIEHSMDEILNLEYLRYFQSAGKKITIQNCNSFLRGHEYRK